MKLFQQYTNLQSISDPHQAASLLSQAPLAAELEQFAMLRISGPDSEKFLQGQLSCNMREVTAEQARFAVHCNPKGRIISSLLVLRWENDYVLIMPRSLQTIARQALQKYAIFSKVELHDITTEWIILGLMGEHFATHLTAPLLPHPLAPMALYSTPQQSVLRLPYSVPSYMVCCRIQEAIPLLQQQLTAATPVHYQVWNLLSIQAGIAWIEAATSELFTPHELNYQYLDMISFDKGCFTGQEIIARMHYRAKLKSHTYRLALQTEALPQAGEQLTDLPGTIVNAAPSQNGHYDALVHLSESARMTLTQSPTPPFQRWLPLPYQSRLD